MSTLDVEIWAFKNGTKFNGALYVNGSRFLNVHSQWVSEKNTAKLPDTEWEELSNLAYERKSDKPLIAFQIRWFQP